MHRYNPLLAVVLLMALAYGCESSSDDDPVDSSVGDGDSQPQQNNFPTSECGGCAYHEPICGVPPPRCACGNPCATGDTLVHEGTMHVCQGGCFAPSDDAGTDDAGM